MHNNFILRLDHSKGPHIFKFDVILFRLVGVSCAQSN